MAKTNKPNTNDPKKIEYNTNVVTFTNFNSKGGAMIMTYKEFGHCFKKLLKMAHTIGFVGFNFPQSVVRSFLEWKGCQIHTSQLRTSCWKDESFNHGHIRQDCQIFKI